jgi:hypothetical protein
MLYSLLSKTLSIFYVEVSFSLSRVTKALDDITMEDFEFFLSGI